MLFIYHALFCSKHIKNGVLGTYVCQRARKPESQKAREPESQREPKRVSENQREPERAKERQRENLRLFSERISMALCGFL